MKGSVVAALLGLAFGACGSGPLNDKACANHLNDSKPFCGERMHCQVEGELSKCVDDDAGVDIDSAVKGPAADGGVEAPLRPDGPSIDRTVSGVPDGSVDLPAPKDAKSIDGPAADVPSTCTNGCTLGDHRCGTSGGIQECAMNGSCPAWGAEQDCAAADCKNGNTFTAKSTCMNGACVAPAPQTCSIGCSSTGCTQVTQISCGYYQTCALLGDGTVRCWGDNMYGQLGTGATSDHSTSPLRVTGVSEATAIVSGYHHACALVSGGTAMCWGSNVGGAVGLDPTLTTLSATPLAIDGLAGAIGISSSSGALSTCAILSGGSIKCWGSNTSGQLGNMMTSPGEFKPVTVSGVTAASSVVVGAQSAYALGAGGVKGWGSNQFGQLATDTPAQTSTAIDVNVGGVSRVIGLAASGHACGVLVDGSVRCWGNNDSGQLGNGMTGPGGPPVDVVTDLPAAKAVAAYPSATCVVLSDGTVRCWGSAPLGDGSSTSTAPVVVTGLSGAKALCTGGAHGCALLTNGSVKCWGYNQKGQLGDGTTTFRPTPVTVTGW